MKCALDRVSRFGEELSGVRSRARALMRASADSIFGKLLLALLVILIAGAVATVPAEAKKKHKSKAHPPPGAQEQKTGVTLPQPPPYQAQLSRLAEILGALTYLDELCSSGPGKDWRVSMKALMDAEARTDLEKDLLAGAFNRSYRGYETSYRVCTMNARIAIVRFLAEGRQVAHDVVDRYGAS